MLRGIHEYSFYHVSEFVGSRPRLFEEKKLSLLGISLKIIFSLNYRVIFYFRTLKSSETVIIEVIRVKALDTTHRNRRRENKQKLFFIIALLSAN